MKHNPLLTRRQILQAMGITAAVPMLESLFPSHYAWAQATGGRNKFVGVFAPNGFLMPFNNGVTENGDFTWSGALDPLTNGVPNLNIPALRNHTMVVRGLFKKSVELGLDLHWNNTAGFLSASRIEVPSRNTIICGKSIDQLVADKFSGANAKPIRSIDVGWRDYGHDADDHPTYSDLYLNCIAWKSPTEPIRKIDKIRDLYARLFDITSSSKEKVHQNKHKRDLVNRVWEQLRPLSTSSKLSTQDQSKIRDYMEGLASIRDTEIVDRVINCGGPIPNLNNETDYIAHFKAMHKMVVFALQCDLTSSATIQYDSGVGDQKLKYQDYLTNKKMDNVHHTIVHNVQEPAMVEECKSVGRMHTFLFAHFLNEMKNAGLLESSLVLYGSNMSNGQHHKEDNLPLVLAGAGSDLRFGQEITAHGIKPFANLLNELASIMGIPQSSLPNGTFGNDDLNRGTGGLSSIRA